MSRADDILDLIDAGLQSTTEASYGTDYFPDRCARCQDREPDDGDLCAACRSFLLGDSDEDPAEHRQPLVGVPFTVHVDLSGFIEAVQRLGVSYREALANLQANLDAIAEDLRLECEQEPEHVKHERRLLARMRRSHRRTNRW